mgnify:CR=1 FL=1
MAKTGPQRYPGASTAYWYGSKYPGSAMETNVVVWHSTEGTTVPSYGGGASAPTLTAAPDFKAKRLVWYQHFDFDASARALRNTAGGVETNTANVCQVEVVGTCDPTTHRKWGTARPHLYMPELPDWAIRDLAAFARWAHEQHGVRLESGLTFKAYPASYGANGVRMSATSWRGFYGHCGHQHVPENDHGDPGAWPMAAILAAAKGADDRTEEDDMPTPQDIARAVWGTDGIIPAAPDEQKKGNSHATGANWVTYLGARSRESLAEVAKLRTETAQLRAEVAELRRLLPTGGVDPGAVAAAVVEQIAARLNN